jgi:c(7)-type cytochrome triheme protein
MFDFAPLSTHALRATEYLVAGGSLLLFVLLWRYVGESRPRTRTGGRTSRAALLLIAALPLAATAAAAGPGRLRLPVDHTFRQGADSPGPVTFRHASHVDPERPACTGCHPGLFPILRGSPRHPVTHARMDARRQCGACHDGEHAFGRDDCTACHRP